MTKRFKNVIEGNFVLFYDGDEQIPFDEVVGVLNSLNDENEQLKQSNQKLNDELQETMGYLALKSGVEKENEQLKSQREDFKRALSEKDKEIMKLRRENNQMRRILND